MLKTTQLELTGKDRGRPYILTELPALVADRAARRALAAIGAPLDGGVVSLAFEHVQTVLKLGETATALLQTFVQLDRPLRDWRNILTVQQAALALHAGFVLERTPIEAPVAMRAASIKQGDGELVASFCSPGIAAVIQSGRASYRELETVLSTEDAYNLVELLNIEAVRDWHAHQSTRPT